MINYIIRHYICAVLCFAPEFRFSFKFSIPLICKKRPTKKKINSFLVSFWFHFDGYIFLNHILWLHNNNWWLDVDKNLNLFTFPGVFFFVLSFCCFAIAKNLRENNSICFPFLLTNRNKRIETSAQQGTLNTIRFFLSVKKFAR